MDLHEFVASTVNEVQRGVQSAIERAKSQELSGAVNPVWGKSDDINASHTQLIQFDVAVTAVEKATGGADAGIQVVGIKLGGSGSKARESTHVSRIQFAVPLVLPATLVG